MDRREVLKENKRIAIVGCSVIKGDLLPLLTDLPYEADIFWLDEKLHDVPEKLHTAIQKQLDALPDYDHIILTFMQCGNALVGIKSQAYLHFLISDDCIGAYLNGRDDYNKLRTSCIFLSHGWLSTKNNMISQYHYAVNKYGEEKAKIIFRAIYNRYKEIAFIRFSGDEVAEAEQEKLRKLAELTGMTVRYLNGSLELFRKLLYFENAENICVLPPNTEIAMQIFHKLLQ
ncbi:MAG: DUF1638 domain-containing protein [Firmicutes bacterium]|nr:DUF1638 domain-containing protein [Bacillota bacterium]